MRRSELGSAITTNTPRNVFKAKEFGIGEVIYEGDMIRIMFSEGCFEYFLEVLVFFLWYFCLGRKV